jgi:hypothetical protein
MALKIDSEIVKTSMTEVLMQNIQNFTNGTNGAIQLDTDYIIGDFEEVSGIKEIANIVARRDPTSNGAAPIKNIDSIDQNNVKVYFGTGAVEFKLVDAERYGSNSDAFSMAIGEQVGIGLTNFMLNQMISAAVGALGSNTGIITGDGTADINFGILNDGLSKLGDASQSIVAWVANGNQYHKLMGDAIANYNIDSVTGGSIVEGTTASLGRPIYVTDATGLQGVAVGEAVLGLTVGGVRGAETSARNIFSEIVTGQENLKYRIQAESDVLLRVKGYGFTGTANPGATDLEDPTNWGKVATSDKSTAGILVNVAA